MLAVTMVTLGTGAVVDALTRRIPNLLTYAAATLGVALAFAGVTRVTPAQSVAGCLLGMLFMLPGHLLGATGAGDVKLLGAAGAILGVTRIPAAFLYTAIAGGLFALVIAAARGRLGGTVHRAALVVATPRAGCAAVEAPHAGNAFPYGPAIAVGCTLAALGL